MRFSLLTFTYLKKVTSMMKKLIPATVLIFLSFTSPAQITGDSVVCAGWIYQYQVSIPGAVTYNWTVPAGWYGLTGQGSSQISVTCNVGLGTVCVEGFDSLGTSLSTDCIGVQWGGG